MSEYWTPSTRQRTDELYNPTLWTFRLPTDELLPSHIAFTQEKSEQYRKEFGFQTKAFGEADFGGQMDIFRTKSVKEDAPIVIYIHGGWWQWFSKEQFSFLAEPFNKHGYAVYMPGYRLAQEWGNSLPMESILKQLEFAVVEILKEAAKKASPSIYIVGHSAGGHLAAMLHKVDWSKYGIASDIHNKIKGIFSLAGLFDIRPLVNSFINVEINMSFESAEKVSPLLTNTYSDTKLCPIHLLVPEFDTPEFFRQTKEYQHALLSENQVCYFRTAYNRDHLDIIENLIKPRDEVMAYLIENMDR